jgi:hypothetical protein
MIPLLAFHCRGIIYVPRRIPYSNEASSHLPKLTNALPFVSSDLGAVRFHSLCTERCTICNNWLHSRVRLQLCLFVVFYRLNLRSEMATSPRLWSLSALSCFGFSPTSVAEASSEPVSKKRQCSTQEMEGDGEGKMIFGTVVQYNEDQQEFCTVWWRGSWDWLV